MEISRKEKFGTKKRATKKWPKVVLATTIALGIGGTTTLAAKPELANALYSKILEYTYKSEIESELNQEKQTLLKDVSSTVRTIFSNTKDELDQKKSSIITDKKSELKAHYNQEIADITKRKIEAVDKKTEEMKTEATKTTNDIKVNITEEIEKEVNKADINKK